ncbi:MAG: transporter substrate-binding domain-containing protein [Burkholderiales bacterium]|nr:transporter substrate-binding domain-containing protein [Burkholderiales bacterium]
MIAMLAGSVWAAPKPATITLCEEDQDNYPWVIIGHPGYTSMMMNAVAARVGTRIVIVAKPWKRCLNEMKINAVDGVLNASFAPERMEMGNYPMRDGELDNTRRMLTSHYSLYRLKGSEVNWDGRVFSNVNGPIGAQNSFSIINNLREAGVKVDDSSKKIDDLMRYLLLGSVVAVAAQTEAAEYVLAKHPEFRSRIERLPVSLAEKPYYTMFSKQMVAQYPAFTQEVWNAIAFVRESPEFAKQVSSLLSQQP